ncbi:MAG: hypothetical protein WCI11_07925 [Candidatus Methylumidiphilus sp.]
MAEIRRLIYVPILHAQEDPRESTSLNKIKDMAKGGGGNDATAVEAMWEGIAAKIEALNLPWESVRIYQDGAPVCGNELELAMRLANSGSPNFAFILDLIEKGARLEGTEEMDLLIKEYDLLSQLLMKNPGAERKAASVEYQAKSRELLAVRDEFIFNRITDTLNKGEVALVFMGVMHRLDKLLEKDFLVSYVIYRLPFRSVGSIYNA